MKSLSRILTVCLCCVPAFGAVAAPVATTAGSNLTAYNPSNAYNNQWATVSNARYDGNNTTAKVDFGNCNAVVLRCAQPKCSNGGCADVSVAAAIVSGCVKSNSKCKQYGDDLIEYMTAQLVANSNAKINEQQMAIEQARLQAQANAAAASAQSEQISQMQNQMAQMQQQMYQQQQESAQALQEALAQQAAQSQAAIDNMKTAATEAAKQNEAGITAYQQDAINRGISSDVLARKQITGQIQTQIEDAETSMIAMKKAMQNAFDYAGCDARGNNCTGPRRIKKWRELANGFLTPYDTAIDKIYDALTTAQSVGVDLTDIYMMLNNSCNSWGQYMCEKGANIEYPDSGPVSCPKAADCNCWVGVGSDSSSTIQRFDQDCYKQCLKDKCKPCTLLKVLTDKADVYEGWINTDATDNNNSTVVACASNVLDKTPLFSRRTKNKNGAGLIDINLLDTWINQTEPDKVKKGSAFPQPEEYCGVEPNGNSESALESAILSRSVNTDKNIKDDSGVNNLKFCVDWDKDKWTSNNITTDECPYINPTFAICDTHPFNMSIGANDWQQETKKVYSNEIEVEVNERQSEMNRIIGMKITVVSQQMYKQYEYLNATLRRLTIQLQKAVLTSNLESAGAKSESGSSIGGLLGANNNKDKTVVLEGAINCSYQVDFDRFVDCVSGNVQSIIRAADSTASKKNACLQLQYDLEAVDARLKAEEVGGAWTRCKEYITDNIVNTGTTCKSNDRDDIKACANEIVTRLSIAKRNLNNKAKSLRDLLSE